MAQSCNGDLLVYRALNMLQTKAQVKFIQWNHPDKLISNFSAKLFPLSDLSLKQPEETFK